MSKVSFSRLDSSAGAADIINKINELMDELEYILTNLDEENTTDAYENKEDE